MLQKMEPAEKLRIGEIEYETRVVLFDFSYINLVLLLLLLRETKTGEGSRQR